jgi:hypothetical protein
MSSLPVCSAASMRSPTTSRSRWRSSTRTATALRSQGRVQTSRHERWPWLPRSSTSFLLVDCFGRAVIATSARRDGSPLGFSVGGAGRRSRSVGSSGSTTRRSCTASGASLTAASCSCARATPRRASRLRTEQRGNRSRTSSSLVLAPVPPAASVGSLVALLSAPGQPAMRASGACLFGSPRARVPPENAALGPRGAGGAPGSAPRRQPQEEPSHEGPRDHPHPPRRDSR